MGNFQPNCGKVPYGGSRNRRRRINDVNQRDPTGNTALLNAVSEGNVEVTQLLLSRGADANVKNNNGISGLHHAATLGHEKLATLLLDHGAKPNVQNDRGNTPSHDAAQSGQLTILRMLDKHGADWSIENHVGHDVLFVAETSDRQETKQPHFLVSVRSLMSGQRRDQLLAASNSWPLMKLTSASTSSDISTQMSHFEPTDDELAKHSEGMPLLWEFGVAD